MQSRFIRGVDSLTKSYIQSLLAYASSYMSENYYYYGMNYILFIGLGRVNNYVIL